MIDQLLEKYKQIPNERFFTELFEKKEYADTLSRKADIVVDVGALAGEFSAYIYDKAGIIYALEPYSKYYQELVENIKEFNLEKIKPYQIALSDINGIGKLSTECSRGGNVLLYEQGPYEEVITKTLAKFMQEENISHIDILKIDIEGGEEKVFGSKDFAVIAPKISYIIGEHIYDHGAEYLRALGFREKSLNDVNRNFIYENPASYR